MKYVPHDYQKYAIEYIVSHPVAAVLLDMGLGKTSIALTALRSLLFDSFEAHRILIIAPLRVARDTWPSEIEKWDHLKDLTYSVAVGTERERKAALMRQTDICIINRENVQWLIEESGLPFSFDTVVVDELSSFKSHQSKRFKALLKVRPRIRRIVGLTGTPSSNGLMDLWAEYRILDMGQRLGRFISMYRNSYFEPDQGCGQIVYSYKLLPGAEKAIYGKISDITISMKAADHLKMPELVINNHIVKLSKDEKERYERLRRNLVLKLPGEEITAANAAVLSGKLLQMANGAVYTDSGTVEHIHDRKLDALEDLIEAANGKSVLIAYWFRHDLVRIEKRMDEMKIHHGRLDSERSIREWNSGSLPVGLIHPASAGHGLNLQDGGNTLVWFGMIWSLELYRQTIARLWRQGQQSGTVVVTHILTDDTIDIRISNVLSQKDRTQARLIDAVKAELVPQKGSADELGYML